MRIPTKGRYAVSAMLNLAIHDRLRPVTIADIAVEESISLSYLEQLFARLRKRGLVEGTRGPGGGYRLAQSAEKITIAQIIQAVDDKDFGGDNEQGHYLPYALWDDLSDRLQTFLEGITLADCIDRPDVKEYVSNSRQGSHAPAVI